MNNKLNELKQQIEYINNKYNEYLKQDDKINSVKVKNLEITQIRMFDDEK